MTDDVIRRVEAFRQQQNQPFRVSKMLKYEWRLGVPIVDDDLALQVEDRHPVLITPPVIAQQLPDAGPNPLFVLPPPPPELVEPQGAETYIPTNNVQGDIQQHHPTTMDQGAETYIPTNN